MPAVTPTIATGSMREKVRIERLSQVGDGMGGFTSNWQSIAANLSARIVPLGGTERLIAEGLQATGMFTIVIRYSTDVASVTGADRLVNERTGVTYNIRNVSNPDERHRFIQIVCETGIGS